MSHSKKARPWPSNLAASKFCAKSKATEKSCSAVEASPR
eukprot:CAMPEP_0114645170 /NCGR_PEP_ID=MMETSP0191-20121206/4391_1 /TAXON_ID=126664 /ORGANISM="Sorites sp." /LENGTH=38 /DNA_ID= /DNA_START= /DNA_END= /DNA_ORIENTATION=